MLTRGTPRAAQVVVELDKSLFSQIMGEGGIPAWNSFMETLLSQRLVAVAWGPGERTPPLVVLLDLQRLRMRNHRLDGIDLSHCWLADADFEGSSLRGAQMGCCPRASFRSARLHGADFRHVEITATDFSGCLGLETALFDGAAYDPASPPKGLPPEILARCVAQADRLPADPRQPENPAEPRGSTVAPLTCHATVSFMPIEDC